MNCGDFRYLIQRRFDVELSPADDRALLIHLETCESCQRFYHQIQQVIIAAEELELSEDILPQKPQQLLNSILENLPQEQLGLKALLLSLLQRLGFAHSGSDAGKSEILSEIGALPESRKLPVPHNSKSLGWGTAQTSEPISDWGEQGNKSVSSFQGNNIPEEKIEQPIVQNKTMDDQVTTRSLSEKFGMSGANSALNNSQPLTLAESIRQKISEMSKTGGERPASLSESVQSELAPQESAEEWPVPHSPEWPKLDIDTPADQWPTETAGNKAPNVWGSTLPDWGEKAASSSDKAATEFTLGEKVSDAQIYHQPNIQINPDSPMYRASNESALSSNTPVSSPDIVPDSADPNKNTFGQSLPSAQKLPEIKPPMEWSIEAEQLQTGAWQTVEFDTTLGAKGYSSSVTPANHSVLPQANQNLAPSTDVSGLENEGLIAQVTPTASPENPSDLDQPNLHPEILSRKTEEVEKSLPANNQTQAKAVEPGIQDFMPPASNGPKIYPVVSKRGRSSLSFNKPVIDQMPIMPESTALVNTPSPPAKAPAASTPITLPANTPLKAPAASAPINLPANTSVKAPAASAPISSPPKLPTFPAKPIDSNIPSVPSSVVAKSSAMNSTRTDTKTENDPSRLFNFDDGAIDQIFSNNLGVHERSVSTRTTPASPSPSPSPSPSFSNSTFGLADPDVSGSAADFPIESAQSFVMPNTSATNSPASANTSIEVTPPVSRPIPDNTNLNESTVTEPASKPNGLFAIDDNMIDRIFTDHLGVPEQVSSNAVNAAEINKNQPVQDDTARQAAKSSIESLDLSAGEVSPNLSSKQTITPLTPITPTTAEGSIPSSGSPPTPLPVSSAPSKSFTDKENNQRSGQSGYSSSKHKITGVGRLDDRVEVASDPGSGRIAAIGKFLLDNKDLEKIGRITASDLSEGKLRTLTLEANEELKSLLSQVDAQKGVLGTVIVGHDGLLIAHTMFQDSDAESLGVEALGVYMGTLQVVEKLGDDNIRQIVSLTNQGYLIIANFGAGLLVTITDPIMLDGLLPLMRTITQLVAS